MDTAYAASTSTRARARSGWSRDRAGRSRTARTLRSGEQRGAPRERAPGAGEARDVDAWCEILGHVLTFVASPALHRINQKFRKHRLLAVDRMRASDNGGLGDLR